jgi:hypothetical protein
VNVRECEIFVYRQIIERITVLGTFRGVDYVYLSIAREVMGIFKLREKYLIRFLMEID